MHNAGRLSAWFTSPGNITEIPPKEDFCCAGVPGFAEQATKFFRRVMHRPGFNHEIAAERFRTNQEIANQFFKNIYLLMKQRNEAAILFILLV
jgi:hypothetical protein